MSSDVARIPSPGLRELGVINWVICTLASRRLRVPEMHLFTTLGQHKRLLWAWLPFGGMLLSLGKLPKRDTELVILRVGHLRGCEYELQHHRRIARGAGLDEAEQRRIFEGPQAEGLTERQRALLTATDELLETRTLSDAAWHALAEHLDRPQLIEFITLAGQYDALAATLTALNVPLDYPQ
ncbi:carboxymuconolactone decarboxylase family protein [Mycobacterium sp. pUA109]|uniref:carboxymuconolactone decarboxylase family protein n=1 Tax=Mycobacterium sp. pUA109 TaxID=3238982 RepID=UPI00351ADB7C